MSKGNEAPNWMALPLAAQRQLLAAMVPHLTNQRQQRLDAVLAQRTRYLTVLLEDIFDRHNAAAVLRTCDSFGVQDVHLLVQRNSFPVDQSHAAAGSGQWMSLYEQPAPTNHHKLRYLEQLRRAGYQIVATTLSPDAVLLDEVSLEQKLALCFGSEELGLSDTIVAAADYQLRIPTVGFVQSLNVSVAVAIMLHQLTSRLRQSAHPWRLTEAERVAVKLGWLTAVLPNGEQVLAEHWQRLRLG